MRFRSDPKSRFLVTKRTNAKHALLFVRELFRLWRQVDTLGHSLSLSLTHHQVLRITAARMLQMILFVLALLFLYKRVISNANTTKRDRIIQDLTTFCVGYFFFWRGTSWIYFQNNIRANPIKRDRIIYEYLRFDNDLCWILFFQKGYKLVTF